MTDDNGILAKIQPNIVARAEMSLPPAATATEQTMTVELVDPYQGRVRITCRREQYRHHKHRWWAWLAVHGEHVELPPDPSPAP